MKTIQENRFNMYLAVKVFLNSKLSVLGTLPNFMVSFTAFLGLIPVIQHLMEKQLFDKKGVTNSKQALKQVLATITGDYARKLYAYALFINDHVLIAETHITQSKIDIYSDATLLETAEGMYSRTTPLMTELTGYGITTGTQLELQNAIDNFASSIPSPRLSKTDSKEDTRHLKDQLKAADQTLAKIDAVIEIIRYTEPDIYKGYKLARKVMKYGTHTLAIKGKVTDADTKEPINGVTITFLHHDGTNLQPPVIKKSAAKGGFTVKTMAEGIYKVKLSKVGYNDQVITIVVNEDEQCKMNAEISKIG